MHEKAPIQVCILAYDGLCTFEFGIAVEAFALPRSEFDRWYDTRTIAAEPGRITGLGGVVIEADHDLRALAKADIIMIPGWKGVDVPVPDDLVAALRKAHHNGARIATICSGVFVLAATGLLDGRRATTHWRYAELLAQRFPDIIVEPDVLFVDEGSLLSSAGSAAGLDLCLHIIRRDFGVDHANAVARRLVLPAQREGGQRQFVPRPVPPERGGRIAPLLDTMRSTLDEPWPMARMANVAGLSQRTLARRFHEATGKTPGAWLTATRVARAVELLETTDLSLTDVASACGFGSSETFRREFRLAQGATPSQFRRAFGQATA